MSTQKNILLADDDADDRLFFEEVLKEVDVPVLLTTVVDGEQLMEILNKKNPKEPMIIFLDLNMPKKNGFECLRLIKKTEKLKNIPVVIYSTSCQQESINKMYDYGASYYLCKPNNFQKLKSSILHIFSIDMHTSFQQPSKEEFVIAY
jgi:CheY-like chemotaxis protein